MGGILSSLFFLRLDKLFAAAPGISRQAARQDNFPRWLDLLAFSLFFMFTAASSSSRRHDSSLFHAREGAKENKEDPRRFTTQHTGAPVCRWKVDMTPWKTTL